MSSRRRRLRELALLARILEEERREDTWEQVQNGTPATVTPIRSNRVETTNSFGPFDQDSDEEAEDIRSVDALYYDSEQAEPKPYQITLGVAVAPVQLYTVPVNIDVPTQTPVPLNITPAGSNAQHQ